MHWYARYKDTMRYLITKFEKVLHTKTTRFTTKCEILKDKHCSTIKSSSQCKTTYIVCKNVSLKREINTKHVFETFTENKSFKRVSCLLVETHDMNRILCFCIIPYT